MQIGMIGLGRMGMNMARRLARGGHEVVAYDRGEDKVAAAQKEGIIGARMPAEFVGRLAAPRVVWLMIPAGAPVDDQIKELSGLLSEGDVIIDGGNSYYKDDIRREKELEAIGLRYLDVGVSGGVWGLDLGYCMMIGGARKEFERVEPLLKTLAPLNGYMYCGPSGAGHFIKMAHNGIEYGMMQAYAEGFEIIEASPYKPDLSKLAHLWNQGSVIRSWLLELAEHAFSDSPKLEGIAGFVEDSGEGRWTVQQAVESGVAAPVITLALYGRFLSRQKDSFSNKVLAALRNQFGGHATAKAGADARSSGAGAGSVRAATPEEARREKP
ncbi:MAG: 6-phosphogluconate dehydrogenase (decarboxylating) [Elusimicrobia bacterium CG11_big_fil_rev_8_21_14_0_20_64_6]|nr:MAG: 6-phosphogluconate dehydrogenase (decarboxylating) [Elusimicrobia bacterium CG11_big_fil_rev_8_21_14_0_20_64_6]